MPIAPRAGLVGCDVYSPWPLPGTIALIPRVVLAGSCRGPVALTPAVAGDQGVVKVFLELSNKNCDHGSHIPEVQLGEVSRLKLRV